MRNRKRGLALLLALMMLLSALPPGAIAAEAPTETADSRMVRSSMLPLQATQISYDTYLDLSGRSEEELKTYPAAAVAEALGIELADGESIVAWAGRQDSEYRTYYNYKNVADFQLVKDGTMDLSMFGDYTGSYASILLIVGEKADQLNPNNRLYSAYVKRTVFTVSGRAFTASVTDSAGKAINLTNDPSYYSSYSSDGNDIYQLQILVKRADLPGDAEAVVTLGFTMEGYTPELYAGDSATGTDLWPEFSTTGRKGLYNYSASNSKAERYTLVIKDSSGSTVYSKPMVIYIGRRVTGAYGDLYHKETGSYLNSYADHTYERGEHGQIEVYTLYKDDSPSNYWLRLQYSNPDGGEYDHTNPHLVKAVEGWYDSAEAIPNDAADIQEQLFPENYNTGYAPSNNFATPVYFTIVNDDGTVTHPSTGFRLVVGDTERPVVTPSEPSKSNDTSFLVKRIETKNGYEKATVMTSEYFDSAYDSYQTLFMIPTRTQEYDSGAGASDEVYDVGSDTDTVYDIRPDTDTVKLYFTSGRNATVYNISANASKPVQSGDTMTFKSGEPVHFNVKAEGEGERNFYVTIVAQQEGRPRLFVNAVSNAANKDENGVATMRIGTDENATPYHDILFANIGTEPLTNITVDDSKLTGMKLHDYWTIGETNRLAGFTKDGEGDYYYGYNDYSRAQIADNFGKLRLVSSAGEDAFNVVSGTLTLSADGEGNSATVALSGIIGSLKLVTDPDQVKAGTVVRFVPHRVAFSTNFVGSAAESSVIKFEVTKGKVPDGMELKTNGELYGVPTKAGEYTFTVKATYEPDPTKFDEKEYTITVLDNTDANVEAANDYTLTARINNITGYQDQTMRVEGDNYALFTKVFLDGEELKRDTDYKAEEGSTVITVFSQTFQSKASSGSHTISAEFRTGDSHDGELTRAAQNFTTTPPSTSGNSGKTTTRNKLSGDNDSSSDSDSSSGSSSSSGGSSAGRTDSGGKNGSSNAPVEVKYTVSNGTASVTAPTSAELSTMALQAQNGTVEIDLSGKGETVSKISLPAGMLNSLSDAVERNPSASRVAFALSTGTLQLDDVTLAAIAEEANGESVQMSMEEKSVSELSEAQRAALDGLKVEKVISALISAGEKAVHDFHGGRVTLRVPFSVPADRTPRGYQVWYVAEGGGRSLHSAEVRNGRLTFRSSHFSDFAVAYAEPAVSYGDVADDAWYASFVDYVSALSLMKGVGIGRFAPDATVTRAMLAQIIYNAEKGKSGAPARFSDVSADAWYADAVNWAAEAGIVSGVGSGRFSPDAQITREQLATMLYNYAGYKGYDVSRGASLSRFPDGGAVSAWADSAVQWAVGCKLIDGIEGALSAGGSATRAQTAKLLTYFFEGYEQ